MAELNTYDLPYQSDPTRLFSLIKHLPWSQLLDSGNYPGERGRYDILVADPKFKVTSQDGNIFVEQENNQIIKQHKDVFETLRALLDQPIHNNTDLPFYGGALGYFGYDILTSNPQKNAKPNLHKIPDLAIGIYYWAIVNDHKQHKTTFITSEKNNPILDSLIADLSITAKDTKSVAPISIDRLFVDTDKEAYKNSFNKIQNYLTEGDCYQINYARCFHADAKGSPWESYKQVRKNNPTPFAAYLNFPFGQILCSSPERFLKVKDQKVESRPIKGTRPRSSDPTKDNLLYQELLNSDKDKAENLMIVDLLRNDLGKSCIPGSIHVPELFSIESYPTIYHLVSSVVGTLANNKSSLDLLKDSFPGGSITGAPKKRAIEIIDELEVFQRGIYCGAIGYINFDGTMDTNIAIRTLIMSEGKLSFSVGGGIVSDSDADQEFQETLDKARAYFDLLGKS